MALHEVQRTELSYDFQTVGWAKNSNIAGLIDWPAFAIVLEYIFFLNC